RRTLGLAPDGSCVAWATGRTTVRIVPWKQLSAKSLGGQGCWATREKWDIGLSREAGESQKNGDVWTSGSLSGVGEPGNRWRRFRFGGDNLLLATGLASGRLQIWDVGTGQFLLYLMDHSAAILHLTFSPDDLLTLVSASQDRTLRVWDMGDDGNMVKVLKGHPGWVRCSAFSPDSSLLCSVGNGKSAFLWTVKSWHLKAKLDAHHHDVVSCDFSPDGAILATASFDSTVCLWEPHSVTLLNKLRHLLPPPSPIFAGGANDHWVKAVAFSPDGMHLATLADDRQCQSYPLGVFHFSFICLRTSDGGLQFWLPPLHVPTLQHLCRLSLRLHLSLADLHSVKLPVSLSRFLNYLDIS
uniref:WD repeat and SOCS box containing 1 n=1 Tax=Eptatretus burgeri TaxID=7764 RepID=A0A8C4QJ82_EPTBU